MTNSVKIFKALGDKNRLKIIKMLENKELCLCEISYLLNLANSTVSKHLSILKNAGLIVDNKSGKWVNFNLVDTNSNDLANSILSIIKNSKEFEEISIELEKIQSIDRNIICTK